MAAALRPFQPADGQIDTLLYWFRTSLDARKKALELTNAARNEADPLRRMHFVVALQHGTTVRALDGSFARVPILDDEGKKLKGFKFLAFNVAQLARYLEHLRIHRPSCMNLFEEANDARPRRIAFDLEYDLTDPRHVARASDLLSLPSSRASFCPEDKEAFLNTTCAILLTSLARLAGRELSTCDCHLLDSCSSTKLSFHIATPLVLSTPESRLEFNAWVAEHIAPVAAPLIDCGVYGAARNMRLAFCTKTGSNARLVPTECVGAITFAACAPSPRGEITPAMLRREDAASQVDAVSSQNDGSQGDSRV